MKRPKRRREEDIFLARQRGERDYRKRVEGKERERERERERENESTAIIQPPNRTSF